MPPSPLTTNPNNFGSTNYMTIYGQLEWAASLPEQLLGGRR